MKALCVTLFLLVSAAQLAGATARSAAREACSTITVPVSVTTKSGQPVDDLSAANFSARLRGKTVPVLSATIDRGPRRVILMLDESRSMWGRISNAKWRLAIAMSVDFAAGLRSQDLASLLTFGGGPRTETSLSADHAALLGQLATLSRLRKPGKTVHGPTAFWDSVLNASSLFNPPRPGDAILVITDGEDNRSKHAPEAVAKQLIVDHIRLFLFRVYDPSAQPGRFSVQPDPATLAFLTRLTGGESEEPTGGPGGLHPYVHVLPEASSAWGNYQHTEQPSFLYPLIEALWDQIRKFYELDLAVPKGFRKMHGWKLKVIPSPGMVAKDLYLSYPRELAPCGISAK